MSTTGPRLASLVVLVFASAALVGGASAHACDCKGKEGAPGQEKKEQAATASGQAEAGAAADVSAKAQAKAQGKADAEAQAKGNAKAGAKAQPQAGAKGQAKAKEKVAVKTQAKGQLKQAASVTAETAVMSKGQAKQAEKAAVKAAARVQIAQGNAGIAHQHVIICHRTGSESNPYVVINISRSAWETAHKPGGHHPMLNGRNDILLAGPSLAIKPGSKGGFDKSQCAAPTAAVTVPTALQPTVQAGVTVPTTAQVGVTPQVAVTAQAGVAAQPAGVAGVEAAAAGKPAPAGGVLGALARVGRGGELPFTGLPLWIAALAAFALLGGGLAVRRATSP